MPTLLLTVLNPEQIGICLSKFNTELQCLSIIVAVNVKFSLTSNGNSLTSNGNSLTSNGNSLTSNGNSLTSNGSLTSNCNSLISNGNSLTSDDNTLLYVVFTEVLA